MDIATIISLTASIAAFVGMIFLTIFLPTYAKEKGKNLATKEDIGAITNEVERVKQDYATQLEKLRCELDQRRNVSNAQFEMEFRAYQEIWNSLVRVRSAFETFQPSGR